MAWGGAELLITEAPLDHADAIAIMSGSATFKERSQRAAELFHAGRAPRIILTNDNHQGSWSNAEQRNPFFYESAAAYLRKPK